MLRYTRTTDKADRDPQFVLDVKGSTVGVHGKPKAGKDGNLYVELDDGLRLPIRRNVYWPGAGADVVAVTIDVDGTTVAAERQTAPTDQPSGGAEAADNASASLYAVLRASKDEPGLAAWYVQTMGMNAKAAKAAAKAACMA